MLMLPIILWWANAPFRFSLGSSRVVVSTISVLALLMSSSLDQNAFAEDRYSMNGSHSRNTVPFSQSNSQWMMKSRSNSTPNVLREGTEIPAMDGRVVMLGRRWAFLPKMHDKKMHDKSKRANRAKPDKSKARSLASHRVPGKWFSKIRLVSTPVNNGQANTRQAARMSYDTTAETKRVQETGPKPWILVENLMLQRIVEAVRADANDDRWVLSGKVNEFFGENRMVIQTAQRSNVE